MPDLALMPAMLGYLRDFPLAPQHPKEEAVVFRRLRARMQALDAALGEPKCRHRRGSTDVDELGARLEALADAGEAEARAEALAALAAAVAHCTDRDRNHCGREEGVVLPAQRHQLSKADWRKIDRALAANADPHSASNTAGGCRQLFACIVELAEA